MGPAREWASRTQDSCGAPRTVRQRFPYTVLALSLATSCVTPSGDDDSAVALDDDTTDEVIPPDDDSVPSDDDQTPVDDDSSKGDPCAGKDVVPVTAYELNALSDAGEVCYEVSGVATTSLFFGKEGKYVQLWMQDESGGPGSGLHVVPGWMEGVAPGDRVTATGSLYVGEEPQNRTLILTSLVNSGPGPQVAPLAVSPEQVDMESGDPALMNVLVELTGAVVTRARIPYEWDCAWYIGGSGVDAALGGWPEAEPGWTVNRVAGVWSGRPYGYFDSGPCILPRSPADYDISNPDCASVVTTGQDTQAARCGANTDGSPLTLTDLVVISPDLDASEFVTAFAVESVSAGPFGGILVGHHGVPAVKVPPVGTLVTVPGTFSRAWTYGPGNMAIELGAPDDLTVGASVGEPAPVVLPDPCAVTEEWEGMLVEIPALTVTDGLVVGCPNVAVASRAWVSASAFPMGWGDSVTVTNLRGVVWDDGTTMSLCPRSEADWATIAPP